MSEHDIHSAFDHLKRDVMTNVQIEERLNQIVEGPRRRWQPKVAVMAGAAVVTLVIGVAILAVPPGTDPNPAPPATGGATTSLVDGTSAPTTTLPGQTGLPDLGIGTVVIANPGAATAASNGVVVIDAETAVGDGTGGLVVLRNETIFRLAPDGTETELLGAASMTDELGTVSLWLHDVTPVDGTMSAVITVLYGQEYPDVFEEIWFLELDSGLVESVYQMVAVESHITRVSAANGRMVVSISFEGGTYFEYLDTAGRRIDVIGPYADSPTGAPEFPELIDQAVLSPDGSTFAYVEVGDIQTFQEGYLSANLVIWDLMNGNEDQRLEIELRDGVWPGRMDYDGVGVVLGRNALERDESLAPVQVASLQTGIINELSTPGLPSLIK